MSTHRFTADKTPSNFAFDNIAFRNPANFDLEHEMNSLSMSSRTGHPSSRMRYPNRVRFQLDRHDQRGEESDIYARSIAKQEEPVIYPRSIAEQEETDFEMACRLAEEDESTFVSYGEADLEHHKADIAQHEVKLVRREKEIARREKEIARREKEIAHFEEIARAEEIARYEVKFNNSNQLTSPHSSMLAYKSNSIPCTYCKMHITAGYEDHNGFFCNQYCFVDSQKNDIRVRSSGKQINAHKTQLTNNSPKKPPNKTSSGFVWMDTSTVQPGLIPRFAKPIPLPTIKECAIPSNLPPLWDTSKVYVGVSAVTVKIPWGW